MVTHRFHPNRCRHERVPIAETQLEIGNSTLANHFLLTRIVQAFAKIISKDGKQHRTTVFSKINQEANLRRLRYNNPRVHPHRQKQTNQTLLHQLPRGVLKQETHGTPPKTMLGFNETGFLRETRLQQRNVRHNEQSTPVITTPSGSRKSDSNGILHTAIIDSKNV